MIEFLEGLAVAAHISAILALANAPIAIVYWMYERRGSER